MTTVFLVSLIVVGLALLGLGALAFVRQRTRLARSLRADGVVTELVRARSRDAAVVSGTEAGLQVKAKHRYRPQVRFTTASGRSVSFVARISTRPARYQVGERVQVIYDPGEAGQAQINSFLDLWFQPLMLSGFGLFAVGMGLVGLLASRI